MAAEVKPRCAVIRSDGTPEGTSIVVDGVELADVCTDLLIRMLPGEGPRAEVRLEVRVTALEILEKKGEVTVFKACANCAGDLTAAPFHIRAEPAVSTPEQG